MNVGKEDVTTFDSVMTKQTYLEFRVTQSPR